MDAFFGSWKVVSKADLDELMEAFGLPGAMRKYINNAEGVITFSQDGDKIVMKNKMFGTTNNSMTVSFRLDEEIDEVCIDFVSRKTIYFLEGDKLIKLQKEDDKETKSIHEIQDGKLILTFAFGDVKSVVTYERT